MPKVAAPNTGYILAKSSGSINLEWIQANTYNNNISGDFSHADDICNGIYKLCFLKSAIFLPSGVMIYASDIFHSFGIVQSNIFSPDLFFSNFKGICSLKISKLSLYPLPRILLQIG